MQTVSVRNSEKCCLWDFTLRRDFGGRNEYAYADYSEFSNQEKADDLYKAEIGIRHSVCQIA